MRFKALASLVVCTSAFGDQAKSDPATQATPAPVEKPLKFWGTFNQKANVYDGAPGKPVYAPGEGPKPSDKYLYLMAGAEEHGVMKERKSEIMADGTRHAGTRWQATWDVSKPPKDPNDKTPVSQWKAWGLEPGSTSGVRLEWTEPPITVDALWEMSGKRVAALKPWYGMLVGVDGGSAKSSIFNQAFGSRHLRSDWAGSDVGSSSRTEKFSKSKRFAHFQVICSTALPESPFAAITKSLAPSPSKTRFIYGVKHTLEINGQVHPLPPSPDRVRTFSLVINKGETKSTEYRLEAEAVPVTGDNYAITAVPYFIRTEYLPEKAKPSREIPVPTAGKAEPQQEEDPSLPIYGARIDSGKDIRLLPLARFARRDVKPLDSTFEEFSPSEVLDALSLTLDSANIDLMAGSREKGRLHAAISRRLTEFDRSGIPAECRGESMAEPFGPCWESGVSAGIDLMQTPNVLKLRVQDFVGRFHTFTRLRQSPQKGWKSLQAGEELTETDTSLRLSLKGGQILEYDKVVSQWPLEKQHETPKKIDLYRYNRVARFRQTTINDQSLTYGYKDPHSLLPSFIEHKDGKDRIEIEWNASGLVSKVTSTEGKWVDYHYAEAGVKGFEGWTFLTRVVPSWTNPVVYEYDSCLDQLKEHNQTSVYTHINLASIQRNDDKWRFRWQLDRSHKRHYVLHDVVGGPLEAKGLRTVEYSAPTLTRLLSKFWLEEGPTFRLKTKRSITLNSDSGVTAQPITNRLILDDGTKFIWTYSEPDAMPVEGDPTVPYSGHVRDVSLYFQRVNVTTPLDITELSFDPENGSVIKMEKIKP